MKLQTEWIAGELGADVPFHLSRYFPMYKRDDSATSQDLLDRMYEIPQKIEEKLRNLFGTKVMVRTKSSGGSIEIEFYSPDDLNRLLEIFDHMD